MDDFNNISENLSYYKTRNEKNDQARSFWITLLVKNATQNGVKSFDEISKLLEEAGAVSVSDVLTACDALKDAFFGELHSDVTFHSQKNKPYIVSNFVNALSEQTYYDFFGDDDYKVINRDNFIEIFEDVYNERSNYCIVPIENTISGKLLNFYSLILNYNLKIIKICDIEHSGQDASTRFALVASSPVNVLLNDGSKYCFEINISAKSDDCLRSVLEAAEGCKMYPCRIDSIPSAHLQNEYSFNIVFKLADNASVPRFLGFLSIKGISFTPIGIFKCL